VPAGPDLTLWAAQPAPGAEPAPTAGVAPGAEVAPGAAAAPLESIERKSLLYRSALGFWCANHVQGCSHGCRYPCHAFLIARRYGRVRDYADWCRPRPVANALELLDRELARRRALPDTVQLCLSTDPFMTGHPAVTAMSLAIVERLNRAGVAASLLTKGLLPVDLADRGRFPGANTHGISLVSLDEGFRAAWEPGTTPYADRIAALRRLHDAGRRSYAHLEPYPTPNIVAQDVLEILRAVDFVDEISFGGWNYNPVVDRFPDARAFYARQADLVRAFCAGRGIACEIG
jgi:DNA repair photolyase